MKPGDHSAQGLPTPILTPQQGVRSLLPPPKACRCHPPRQADVPTLPPASHRQAGYQGRWHGDEDASPAAGLAPAGRCFVRTPGPLRRRDKPKNLPLVPNIPSASSRRPRRRSSPLVSFPQQRAGGSFLFSPPAPGRRRGAAGRKGRTMGAGRDGQLPTSPAGGLRWWGAVSQGGGRRVAAGLAGGSGGDVGLGLS